MGTFLNDLIGTGLIKAIYLTLFHSLWQGALIAVIAGIIMMATKKASAAWRYNLLLSSLLLFVLCVGFTFIKQSESAINNTRIENTLSINVPAADISGTTAASNDLQGFTDKVVAFCNDHANAIVVFWFLVICFKCIQLFIGLSGTSALKKKMIFPAGPYWENRLKELSGQLGITQYIKLAESGIAKVPLTIGYFKPVILIPLGLLAALPQDQIEAILLHELAHIRRKDYLVNILQSLVEILFFFNPAIWWLSSLLRTERENCCDDLAIATTSNKFNYIKALVAFEEYQGQMPQYASALTGSKNHLLNRAKRLIYNHNKTLNPMEKIILTCGLAVTGMLTLAFTQVEKHIIQKHNTSAVAHIAKHKALERQKTVFFQDTVKKNHVTGAKVDGKSYKIVTQNNVVTELYVDNVRIPNEKISDYKSITDKILGMWTGTKKQEQSRLLQEDSRKLAAESKEKAEKMSIKHSEEAKLMTKDAKQAEKSLKEPTETKAMAKQAKELSKESQLYAKDVKEEKTSAKLQVEKLERQIENLKLQKEKLEKIEKLERTGEKERKLNRVEYTPGSTNLADRSVPAPRTPMTYKPSLNSNQRIAPLKPLEPMNYNVDSISKRTRPVRTTNSFSADAVEELMRLGIITDKRVKFTINNDELIVNGVKQSDEVHQKVLEKMNNKPSGKIEFSYNHE